MYDDRSSDITNNIKQTLANSDANQDIANKLKVIAGGFFRNELDVDQQDAGLIVYSESLKKIIKSNTCLMKYSLKTLNQQFLRYNSRLTTILMHASISLNQRNQRKALSPKKLARERWDYSSVQ